MSLSLMKQKHFVEVTMEKVIENITAEEDIDKNKSQLYKQNNKDKEDRR